MKKHTSFFIFVVVLAFSTAASAHYIGEYYQGGVIFWIDDNDEHGLIASLEDQGTNVPWAENSYVLLYAFRDGVFAGKFNTEQIVNKQRGANESYAALLAKNYNGEGYNDWYLPSRYELNLLFKNKDIIGGINISMDSNKYWSSTEYPVNPLLGVCVQSFKENHRFVNLKENLANVRAIRAF